MFTGYWSLFACWSPSYIWGALIGAAASVGGGILQNDAASDEASWNRDWQTEMSNTAYQRAIMDMKAAGLNPMLAYSQGGASTPSGSPGAVPSNLGVAAAQGAAAGMAAQQADASIDLARAQAAQASTQARVNTSTAAQSNWELAQMIGTTEADLAGRRGRGEVSMIAGEKALKESDYFNRQMARANEVDRAKTLAETGLDIYQDENGKMQFSEKHKGSLASSARRELANAAIDEYRGTHERRRHEIYSGATGRDTAYLRELGASAGSASAIADRVLRYLDRVSPEVAKRLRN